MKWLDEVRVTSDKYENRGIKKGDIGTIILSEIRELAFEVAFTYPGGYDDELIEIYVGDLELVRDIGLTNEDILEDLPGHDPNWWCKVENGYILNLKGERKNKIPYDYKS